MTERKATLRPRMRPAFAVELTSDPAVFFAHLRERLAAQDAPFTGQVLDNHALVKVPRERRTVLSPCLNLELDASGGRTVLRGRFHPRPNVWTGFMAIYGVLGLSGLGGLMYGFAQMTVDQKPWAMLAVPVALILIAFVYGAAVIGQGLSLDVIYEMRAFVEEIVESASRDHEPAPSDS